MRVVLVGQNNEPDYIEVDESTDFETFQMIASSYVNIDPKDILLKKDGRPLTGKPNASVKSIGVVDGDVIAASKKRDQAPQPSKKQMIDFAGISASSIFNRPVSSTARMNNISESEKVRKQLLSLTPQLLSQYRMNNPKLIENINNPSEFSRAFDEQKQMIMERQKELDLLTSSNQMDPAVQQKIEELIRRQNIDTQMEHAMEHNPEAFAQTTMLYINCKVNKQPLKAFVDSGAQMTFISSGFARRSNIEHLIDNRWRGIAKGVGTQNIVGRIHCVQFEVSGAFLQISVSVLGDQEMDMLIGLDMLKRYQCIINLQRNVLQFASIDVETPFLPENELPQHARLNNLYSNNE